jgi:pilus assembly protein CpaB
MSRRRAAAMLGAAVVCAGLAVSAVDRYAGEVEARVGPLVPVVVATGDIRRGRTVTRRVAATLLAQRLVPRRFAPPAALRSRADAIGFEVTAAVAAGDYVGGSQLGPPGSRGEMHARWSGDARVVQVAVAGAHTIAEALRAGSLVDVLITTERGRSAPRTFLALQRVPVVGFEPGAGGSLPGDGRSADGRVTLRATLRQAVLLTAADNFAREIRVIPRATGDHRRLLPISISASGLDD